MIIFTYKNYLNYKKIFNYLLEIAEEMNNKKIYTLEQKEIFKLMINLIVKKKLTEDEKEVIKNKLSERSEDNMLAVLDMIEEENKRIFAQGEKKGVKQGLRQGVKQEKNETARKMKAENIPIETIVKITGLSKEKIEKLA